MGRIRSCQNVLLIGNERALLIDSGYGKIDLKSSIVRHHAGGVRGKAQGADFGVLSIVFRKIVSGKMKFCAGRSGEGAAKPRLGASEHVPAALSRVPRQRHSSE